MKKLSYLLILINILLIPGLSFGFNGVDLSDIDIVGLKLGMTLEKFNKIYPRIKIKEEKLCTNVINYYSSYESQPLGELTLRTVLFTSDKEGQTLYDLEIDKNIDYPFSEELIEELRGKFGQETFLSRMLFKTEGDKTPYHFTLCWGNCTTSPISHGQSGKSLIFNFFSKEKIKIKLRNNDIYQLIELKRRTLEEHCIKKEKDLGL